MVVSEQEKSTLQQQLIVDKEFDGDLFNSVLLGDCFDWLPKIKTNTVDLLILDPPYNLRKSFGDSVFKKLSDKDYSTWIERCLDLLHPLLKPTASVYVCCDWQNSHLIQNIFSKKLIPKNRITWEREKGRGAKSNWKNCSEDIWFFTNSENYTFNVESVKLKKRVIAPYRDISGNPKDWKSEDEGNYRLTFPSNLWTDISIPFWSMPENTEHPTQKPEKLIAKLILASSNKGDFILDPFGGSGTTAVVAKKLGRNYLLIEREIEYALLAIKRLNLADEDKRIQGYEDGMFNERNINIGKK